MQNADKMHLFCCHSQQLDSCKSCDFHFITIRSLAHGFGNARFFGRTYFSSFTSCQLVAKVALAGLLSLWSPSAWAPPAPALRHHHPRHRPQHVKHLQDDQHWHHLWHQSYSGQGGESAQERIIDMIGSSLHFRRWSYINRKGRDELTYGEDHWYRETLYVRNFTVLILIVNGPKEDWQILAC